jgi:hypothetical protein
MAEARGRAQRRHVREKATIDHLVRDVYEPKAPDEKHTERSPHHVYRLTGRGSGPQGMGSSQGRPSHFLTDNHRLTSTTGQMAYARHGGRSYRQILVQEYNFSPGGATYQREDSASISSRSLISVSRLFLTRAAPGRRRLQRSASSLKRPGAAAQVSKIRAVNGAFRHRGQSTQPAVNF